MNAAFLVHYTTAPSGLSRGGRGYTSCGSRQEAEAEAARLMALPDRLRPASVEVEEITDGPLARQFGGLRVGA